MAFLTHTQSNYRRFHTAGYKIRKHRCYRRSSVSVIPDVNPAPSKRQLNNVISSPCINFCVIYSLSLLFPFSFFLSVSLSYSLSLSIGECHPLSFPVYETLSVFVSSSFLVFPLIYTTLRSGECEFKTDSTINRVKHWWQHCNKACCTATNCL